jgi:hypothetical protein
MAYQTSKVPEKHSTPRLIGRLMDADLFGGHVFYSRCISEGLQAGGRALKKCPDHMCNGKRSSATFSGPDSLSLTPFQSIT